MIFVNVILKMIKVIFIHNYLHCYKIPKGYSFNSSNVSDYLNVIEITSTLHCSRFTQNRFPEQKMLGNDRMETASTLVTSIRRRNNIEKSTSITHRYFADFESRIFVKISTSNRCQKFQEDFSFKIDEVSTNFQRGISTSNL